MKRLCRNLIILLMSIVCAAAQAQTELGTAAFQSFKLAPSYFVPNTTSQKTGKRLVDDPQVSAFVQTQKGRVLFTPSGAYIGMPIPVDKVAPDKSQAHMRGEDADRDAVAIKTRAVFIKAGFSSVHAKKRRMVPRLEEPTTSTVTYQVGPKESWRTEIPTYSKLVYDDVWDGITLEYLGFMDRLQLQLVLKSGSDPDQIVMETGGEKLRLMEDGRLLVSLAGAELVLSAPVAFQSIDGVKVHVAVAFKMLKDKSIGFSLGNYAPGHRLIIEPSFTWSTFLGGSNKDEGYEVALDPQGNVFVAGRTLSTNYPTTSGAYAESWQRDGRAKSTATKKPSGFGKRKGAHPDDRKGATGFVDLRDVPDSRC